MITTIGVMIGFYIFTRMLSFLSRSGDRAESLLVKIFAILTIAVTALGVGDLIISGYQIPRIP